MSFPRSRSREALGDRLAIDFVIAGGESFGLGHVARCAAIARAAHARGGSVRSYLNGDEAAARAWHSRAGLPIDGAWADWRPDQPSRIVALDFPSPKRDWLDRLVQVDQPALVIDDPRDVASASWLLLPGLHHARLDETSRPPVQPRLFAAQSGPRTLAGGRYAILPEAHRQVRAVPLEERRRLLISLGGSDPHGATSGLVRALSEAIGSRDAPGVDVVLGPCFAEPEGPLSAQIEAAGFDVHRSLDSHAMARLMSRAKVALVGFGTSVTELAWHGTPFLCITHHPHDLAPARRLQQAGLGRVLGDASDRSLERIALDLHAALGDRAWQRRSAAFGRALLGDGLGAERVLDALAAHTARQTILPPQRIETSACSLSGATGSAEG